MEIGLDKSALLARSYTLDGGMRVRLRLVQVRDGPAIRTLLERHGLAASPLELARLARFDPRRRMVICASTLLDATETIVGLAAIELDASEPDFLFVDAALTQELRDLLTRALVGRAHEIADRRAA